MDAIDRSPGEDYDCNIMETDTESLFTYDSSYDLSAEEQWQESIKQISTLFTLVIFPVLGKLSGRIFSRFIWSKISRLLYS